jgi:drug/metabolite transporter (DMT)-like permease
MHPVLLSLIAVTFYSVNAVLIERFLNVNHPQWSQLIVNAAIPVLCIGTIVGLRTTGIPVELKTPPLQTVMLAVICGLIYFLGNHALFCAYTNGGSVTTVTTVLCMLPVISTLFGLCLGGKAPAMNEIIGAIIVIVGIVVLVYPKK